MTIKILGTGCSRCDSLEKMTRKAVEELHLDATVEKVGDMQEILKYKVIRTPGLVINDQVVLTGSVPKLTELKSLLHHISQKE